MRALTRRQWLLLGGVAVLTAAAGVMHYSGASPTATFVAAALALAGLAWVGSFATEQVGQRFGPAATGFMQSTLGNLPEFFIVIFALSAGETVVAQTSLIGSLFANALLVLGIVVIVGGRGADGGHKRFSPRLPRDTTTLLLLAVFTIVIIGQAVQTDSKAAEHVGTISVVGAIALLVVYGVWLKSYLRSDNRPREETHSGAPQVPLAVSVVLLTLAGTGAAFVSDWFIAALDPAVRELGISKEFAGLVLVAIAGNAVENATGVILAAKGQADLAISVVKNSVAQIARFLFPALVLVSLFFEHTLTFQLSPVYIGALLLTALAIWQITGDGEAAEFEGAALLGIYAVLAAFALAD